MARDFATINTSIWGNPDVRALPLDAQGLYLQLWTHPELTYAGVLDWRPGRSVAPLSAGSTAESIRGVLPALQERLFVLVDEDTEELLLRSYLRHDGLLKNPKTAVSMTKAYAGVGSNLLRGVMVHELLRLRDEFPSWAAWSVAQVQSILKHPGVDPREVSGAVTPSPSLSVTPSLTPWVTPKGAPTVTPTPTATATATATEASLPGDAKKRETRLSKDWAPNASHLERGREAGIDVVSEAESFRLHAETHDRHAANWNAAFTTWLKKARPSAAVVQLVPKLSEKEQEQRAWLSARGVAWEEYLERKDEPGWIDSLKRREVRRG